MINEEGMIHEMEYNESIGASDHLVLNWTFNSYSEHSTSVMVKWLYNERNYVKMRADLKGADWGNILQDTSVDERWNIIRTRLLESFSIHILQKQYCNRLHH
jgi:hypothetical protein